jgi:chromosome segregation ATPase
MAKRLVLLVLVAFAALALVTAGCGQDEGQEAADEEQAAEQEEQEALEQYAAEAGQAIEPIPGELEELRRNVMDARSLNEFSGPLKGAEAAFRNAAEDLERLDPPEEVASLHTRLVMANERMMEAAARAQSGGGEVTAQDLEDFRDAADAYVERVEEISREFGQRGVEF